MNIDGVGKPKTYSLAKWYFMLMKKITDTPFGVPATTSRTHTITFRILRKLKWIFFLGGIVGKIKQELFQGCRSH